MKTTRSFIVLTGMLLLSAALVSGFALLQTSPRQALIETLETMQTVSNGHAVVSFEMDSIEKDASGVVEIWAQPGDPEAGETPGAFRVEILEASEDKAQGAVIVSDGETLWAYSPAENKAFVGTLEEARTYMEENQDMAVAGEFSEYMQRYEGEFEPGDYDPPEDEAEAVDRLLEYFTLEKEAIETVAGEDAHKIKLQPIAEQMPEEYVVVGGYLNLWVGQESSLPLGIAYTGGSFGEFNATLLTLDVNTDFDPDIFQFEIPEGAEVVTFADLEDMAQQSLSLDDHGSADFLVPEYTPEGATLVDILEVRGAVVQRYTLPEGGSFTVAQGSASGQDSMKQDGNAESQAVEVRGTTGQLFTSDAGDQALLVWGEGELVFSVAGDLSAEQALKIAESLE